ncbi:MULTISPECIES: DUF2970 domain-containing protein [Aeromonas]|uniref:DUF2970 domain-containing protein n=1 Tax=Aeromonas TaxID=642 RepID=UPI0005AB8773|nr:DUF2970 domain-containing protein [Aeromonas bivalvium]
MNQRLSLWHTLTSTLAALFGVQSQRNRQRDFAGGSPLLFILMGLLLIAALVGSLWLLVSWVLG